MTTTPFSFTGSLQLPGDQGLPPDPIPMNMSSSFNSKNELVLNLTASGTMTIPMGTVSGAGLKGLLIKVDPNNAVGAAPVYVKVNGDPGAGEEIAPGGFKANANPSPTDGITAITLTWATDNVVRLWAMG